MTSAAKIIMKRRQRRKQKRELETTRQIWAIIIVLVGLFGFVLPAGMIFGSVLIVYADALDRIPDPQASVSFEQQGSGTTEIYDASGRTVLFALQDPLGDEREWVALDDIPDVVKTGTLLWEDPDFLERPSFDAIALTESMWTNWLSQLPGEQDTTLTGRLVRNVILQRPESQPVTHDDRALEYALVAEINRLYSPDEVLEWHLNTNFYGNEAYGIEAAAQVYLGKSARDLTLDEAAMLVAIPTSPDLNPVDNETAARGRQTDVLQRLLSAGVITQSEFREMINITTTIIPNAGQTPQLAPAFAIYARRQAEDILDAIGMDGSQMVSRGRLRIITTLDIDLYEQVECTIDAHLARLQGRPISQPVTPSGDPCTAATLLPEYADGGILIPPDEGDVVVIDPATGEILTMNGATRRPTYQPGMTLYPFIYLHGFRNSDPNYTPASMMLDVPTPLPGATEGLIYVPSNPDGRYYGPVSLRTAMAASLVTPATRVANNLNLNDIIEETAEPLGISSLGGRVYDLELISRGGAVSMLEMAHAYSVFAGMGRVSGLPLPENPVIRTPVAIRRIEDADGNVLWQYDDDQKAINRVPLLDAALAYLVNDILADNSSRWDVIGRDTPLEFPGDTAVVNGITADQVDNWTLGYTPRLVVGVHLGRTDRGATSFDGYAVDGAAHIWRAIMDYVYTRDSLPLDEWQRPGTMVEASICQISGGAPTEACPTREEIFLLPSYIPSRDTLWELVEINTQTGQRASINTPRELRNTVQYFIPPDEARDWWRANGQPLPPEDFDTVTRPNLLSSTVILQPGNYDIVGGVVDIRGDVDEAALDTWQLSFGEGANPSQWINLNDPQNTFTPGTSLTSWDTSGLDAGTYVLQLRVIRDDGTPESGFAQVTVDNIPPSVVLGAGEPGQIFEWPTEDTIPVVADVTDNVRVSRVDFYRNGQYVSTDEEFPFEYQHSISRTGLETFTAVVYDAVDNSSEATIEVQVVRDGG